MLAIFGKYRMKLTHKCNQWKGKTLLFVAMLLSVCDKMETIQSVREHRKTNNHNANINVGKLYKYQKTLCRMQKRITRSICHHFTSQNTRYSPFSSLCLFHLLCHFSFKPLSHESGETHRERLGGSAGDRGSSEL